MIRGMNERVPFLDQVRIGWRSRNSLLCVGLDPDPARLPAAYRNHGSGIADGVLGFCREVVDATADLVCAFKPQIAYFAALGLERELEKLIRHIHDQHPGVPVILDAKRGDIGDTAACYAREAFERFDADALTVNPYLGSESIQPFLEYADRGVIVLCRTSNPDSAWLQGYPDDGEPVFLRVARAATDWNRNGNVLLVAGATYPAELSRIRKAVGSMPLLVPGVGAQGGSLREVIENGADAQGAGLIINASRAVLYAGGEDPVTAARQAAGKLVSEMRTIRARQDGNC